MNPEEFTGEGNYGSLIATHLGLSHVPTIRVETATSSGMAAMYAGYARIAAGLQRFGARGGRREDDAPARRRACRRSSDGRSTPHERSYGSTMPALAGLITRAAMQRRGLTLKEISLVAVKNHAHARTEPVRALSGAGRRSRR